MQLDTGEGRLVLVGGGDLGATPEMDRRWLEMAGTDPSVVFLPTASGSRKAGGRFTDYYRGLGTETVTVAEIFEPADAGATEHCEALEGADLIYIGGGQASRLIEILRGSPALKAMTRAVRRGAVLVAMSAGVRAAGDRAIVRGSGLGALREGSDEGPLREAPDGPVQWLEGFRWLRGVICEPHMYEWNRLGHLFLAKAMHPSSTVIGIDENTSLMFGAGPKAVVEGRGNVYILAGTPSSTSLPDGSRSLEMRGISLELLAAGSTMEIA